MQSQMWEMSHISFSNFMFITQDSFQRWKDKTKCTIFKSFHCTIAWQPCKKLEFPFFTKAFKLSCKMSSLLFCQSGFLFFQEGTIVDYGSLKWSKSFIKSNVVNIHTVITWYIIALCFLILVFSLKGDYISRATILQLFNGKNMVFFFKKLFS